MIDANGTLQDQVLKKIILLISSDKPALVQLSYIIMLQYLVIFGESNGFIAEKSKK